MQSFVDKNQCWLPLKFTMMDNDLLTQLTAYIRALAPVSDAGIDALIQIAHWATYPKQHTLIRAGQDVATMYWVLCGGLRIYYIKDGKDITDWFAFDMQFITSIESYFKKIPSRYYLQTTMPTEVITFHYTDVERVCAQYSDVEHLMRVVITNTLLDLQQRVVEMQFETAAQRYRNLLQRYPDITQRIALGDIASFLGITQETLSRIRGNVL